ncbi:SDR family NAD(P)-dependent oxidoreductase [Microbacterium rhizomatis]|uniref:SDR family oxidoreductase n=1 Tax=Microbacterium rhizomatis TaxID=1631477 RepID=A0A5J5J4K5_9MICO|nr:SDR family oxidoreductase [Microbacterium rhizomatis]KAA9108253.1 SDR family oxidoreductase [Microbacterium rhizomatis]
MTGRVVMVTGGSRGIGRAIAVGLAQDGAAVVGLQYRSNEDHAADAAAQILEAGAFPVRIAADFSHDPVTMAKSVATRLLDAVEVGTGTRGLDVLVNNAGILEAQELEECTLESVTRMWAANVTAPLFLIQALTPHIRAGGRVINISSGLTRIADPKYPGYSASKGALNALTLSLAPSLAARGITINAVMPGYVETDRLATRLADPIARRHVRALSLFGRLGQPEDIAHAVRYLASDGAGWTTGQVIDVSGGTALGV